MNANEMSAKRLTSIVASLSELHDWELGNAPMLSTLTGRHLYFRIAKRAVGDRELLSRALKDLMGGCYTEKALRIRMREMERSGLIATVRGEADERSRCLMPTEKFYEALYEHSERFQKVFEKNFYLIDR